MLHVSIECATEQNTRPETNMTASPERLEGTVDPKLLEILVCSADQGSTGFDATKQELISRSAKLAYPIRDGIRSCCRKRRGRLSENVIEWLPARPTRGSALILRSAHLPRVSKDEAAM